jgi:ABC-type amino acid transport substrate-binding protein
MIAAASSMAVAGDLQEIKDRGVLRVIAHFDDLRPEFFSRDAAAPGFDHELLESFASLHGLRMEVVEISGGSDTRLASLSEGGGDVVAGRLADLPERRKRFGLTAEVFPIRFVLVTRRPTPPLNGLDELRRHRVGTVRSSRALMDFVEAARVPPERLDDSFKEPSEFLEGLQSGRVNAVVWAMEAALPAQREDPAIQIGAFVGPAASLVYAVHKADVQLLEALDAYIANARRSLTWNRLVVKYFGPDALRVLESARGEP